MLIIYFSNNLPNLIINLIRYTILCILNLRCFTYNIYKGTCKTKIYPSKIYLYVHTLINAFVAKLFIRLSFQKIKKICVSWYFIKKNLAKISYYGNIRLLWTYLGFFPLITKRDSTLFKNYCNKYCKIFLFCPIGTIFLSTHIFKLLN